MTQKLNSFERFWKELKRRKVVHVITVYAATAFVILELVNMVAQPLKLPEWTEAFVIVLLSIGFVIAVLLSWIYDITPTGVRKTKPASKLKHSDHTTHAVSSGWKIASYVSGVVIIALVAFNFISRRNLNADISKLDKSVAVLPFINDSPDTTNAYFINGIMERITTNLQMVKELRVIGRTSVEQYRNNKTKSASEIAKELGVNYVIEGSGQKYGDSFGLTVQLLKAKGKESHLWAKTYDREVKDVNDYISIMSEIAKTIAEELKAVLSPKERELIEKIPTANYKALILYQKGRNEHTKYWIDNYNTDALKRAESYYRDAIKEDINYAEAYSGLAKAIWDKYHWGSLISEGIMDSVLSLCKHALSIDNQLSDAYSTMGDFYRAGNYTAKAQDAYDRALEINPNDPMAFIGMAYLYSGNSPGKAIYYSKKAISIYHGQLLPSIYRAVSLLYTLIGLEKESVEFADWAVGIDRDSAKYYRILSENEFYSGNLNAAANYLKVAYALDTNNMEFHWALGSNYLFQGDFQESLKYFEKWLGKSDTLVQSTLYAIHRVGYAFQQNGNKSAADHYYNEQIKYGNKMIELGQTGRIYYDLTCVHALKGEKQKALDYLNKFYQWMIKDNFISWYMSYFRFDPEFESIRKEPEFQKILQDMENNNQSEKNREIKWLEEKGML